MKKVFSFFLVICLLFCCCGCAGKKPTTITMSAAEMDANGVVWRNCEITLEITKKGSEKDRSGMKYTTYECTVSFYDIGVPFTTHSLICTHFDIDTAWLFTGLGYVPDDNTSQSIVLYMDEKQENCLIRTEGNPRYFVASVDPNFDPVKLDETLTKALSERLIQ